MAINVSIQTSPRESATYLRIGLLFVAALAVSPVVVLPSDAAAQIPGEGVVLFEDNFDGSKGALFDGTKWEDHSGCTYDGTAFFGSINCGDNETLDGEGRLRIPATPTGGSALRTKEFGFRYGVVSAWMKMPSEPGYWPAFWSLNNIRSGGMAYLPVGEVDVVEAYTTWHNVYQAAGHSWTTNAADQYHSNGHRCPVAEDADLSGKFNKFSAKIEPGKITYFFNDVQCGSAYEKRPNETWGFGPDVTRDNWLILQNAVGGAGGQQTPATQPADVLVDRVEVRALATEEP